MKSGMSGAAVFKKIDGAEEIVFEELACAGFAVATSQNAGCAAASMTQSARGKGFKVAGHADVAMEQLHAELLSKRTAVGFAATAGEVIDADDGDVLRAIR